MESVEKDIGKRVIGGIEVFVGQEGQRANLEVGFISKDEALVFRPSKRWSGEQLCVAELSFSCLQIEASILALSMGTEEKGGVIECRVPNPDSKRVSFRFTGHDGDGRGKTLECPNCAITSDPEIKFCANEHARISVNLAILNSGDDGFAWRWTDEKTEE